jgi:predicted AAA+ superfamily ATPase
MLIPRQILSELQTLLGEYPVVTILGPRQAGKTTLGRAFLKGFGYANLEDPESREIARSDPKAFLGNLPKRVIIDEIQRVPELLSYIQVRVDAHPGNGQYVLTGSHQLSLRAAITQSLAGRTALLHLLPFSIRELASTGQALPDFEACAYTGFLPRVHEQSQRPDRAYANYYQTYVERDVRQLVQLKDASLFEKALKLMAGRTGQLIDYSSLANDVGVDAKTIRHWISILEASFIVFKLPTYFENFGKRVVKSPKYYFTETGLLCHLLGIREPAHIARDPLVGAIFENLVVMECAKALLNRGLPAELYFFRDSNGNEVDLLIPDGRHLRALEIKSASTFKMDRLAGLRRFRKLTDRVRASYLIYNGETRPLSDQTQALNFREIDTLIPALG